MTRPIVPAALALLGGIAVGDALNLGPETSALCLLLAAASLITALARGATLAAAVSVHLGLAAAGVLAIGAAVNPRIDGNHVALYVSGDPVTLEGILYRWPEQRNGRTLLYLRTEYVDYVGIDEGDRPVSGNLLITVNGFYKGLGLGDRIRLPCRLRLPHSPANPAARDYRRVLARRRIYARGWVSDPRSVVLVRKGDGVVVGLVRAIRVRAAALIDRAADREARGVLYALLIGDRGAAGEEVRSLFVRTGTAHLLAVSGLHVGIVGAVFYMMARWILVRSYLFASRGWVRQGAALAAILPILLYTAATGAAVPTVRASCMALVFLGAHFLRRGSDAYGALAAAAIGVAALSPGAIFEISFQLSFLSVLSILWAAPRLEGALLSGDGPNVGTEQVRLRDLSPRALYRRTRLWTARALAVSTAVMLGTAPLVADSFHMVAPIGMLANLVLIPMVGFLALPLGLASIVLDVVWPAAGEVLLACSACAVRAALATARIIQQIPGAAFEIPPPTLLESGLWYTGVGALFYVRRSGAARALLLVTLIGVLIDVTWWSEDRGPEGLKATFFSVGNGDAALLELPGEVRILVDGGGARPGFDAGRDVIAPYLRKRRIRVIDTVLLSHPDGDHAGGLTYIIDHFDVREIWTSGLAGANASYWSMIEAVQRCGLRHRLVRAGCVPLKREDMRIEILHPAPPTGPDAAWIDTLGSNDSSVVARVTLGEADLLFTGDIEAAGEEMLLPQGGLAGTEILKVPHHGSRNSSSQAFLWAVRPAVAIVSAGRANRHGFPSPEVAKRCESIGARIVCTGTDGAVTVETDGRSIRVSTMAGGLVEEIDLKKLNAAEPQPKRCVSKGKNGKGGKGRIF